MALVLMTIACLYAPVCVAAEGESSVACDEGEIAEPVTLRPGQHTTGCAVDQNTETDRFRFSGAAGEIVRLTVRGGNVYVDPLIEIRGPDGSVIATMGCDTYYDLYHCAALSEVTLPQSGSYTVFLRDNGADQTGDYTLQLERLFPTGSRQMLQYGVPLDDAIAPVTDTDVLLFAGAAGSTIRLIGQGGNVLVDPILSIRDPSGVEIATAGCDTYYDLYSCSFSTDITLPGGGVFAVIIRDNGGDQEGTYQLSLECLAGECPDDVAEKGILELPGPFMSGISEVLLPEPQK